MSIIKEVYVEFDGNPMTDKIVLRRFSSTDKFEVVGLSSEVIRFINYSIYEAAQKEIEQLTAALKVAEDALAYMTEDYDCDPADVADFDKRRAEEAIAEIQKIKEELG